MNKGTAIEKSKKTKMIFATLKELTTMTPFIREKRLIFASKNPLTTPQEAKDAQRRWLSGFSEEDFLTTSPLQSFQEASEPSLEPEKVVFPILAFATNV